MSSNEPMSAADCANDGWKIYTSHRFKSQKACESYVKKQNKRHHTTKGTGSTSGSSTSRTPAPPQQ